MTPGQQCYETYWRTIEPAANSMTRNWNWLSEEYKQCWDAVAQMKLSEERHDDENTHLVRCPACQHNILCDGKSHASL